MPDRRFILKHLIISPGIWVVLGSLLLTACGLSPPTTSTPVPPPKSPVGTYRCIGSEGGTLAEVGELTIQPDNSFQFLKSDGRWSYDLETRQVAFLGEEQVLQSGVTRLADGALEIQFKRGISIPHAETGSMTCFPQP